MIQCLGCLSEGAKGLSKGYKALAAGTMHLLLCCRTGGSPLASMPYDDTRPKGIAQLSPGLVLLSCYPSTPPLLPNTTPVYCASIAYSIHYGAPIQHVTELSSCKQTHSPLSCLPVMDAG